MLDTTMSQVHSYQQDLASLNELRTHLLTILERPALQYSSLTVCGSTPDMRSLRVSVLNSQVLLSLKQLYFVGFFGQKKSAIPATVKTSIARLDRRLSNDLGEYPFILSYNSMELADRYNWGNLVIFSELEGIERWKQTYHHQRASNHLSPRYFDSVRIHLGRMENGLGSPFVVARTNVYTFQDLPNPAHSLSIVG